MESQEGLSYAPGHKRHYRQQHSEQLFRTFAEEADTLE
jgi:hypothetical protein